MHLNNYFVVEHKTIIEKERIKEREKMTREAKRHKKSFSIYFRKSFSYIM